MLDMIYNIVRHWHLSFHWNYPNVRRLISYLSVFFGFSFICSGNRGLTLFGFRKIIMNTFYIMA